MKNLKIFLIVISLFSINQLSNAAPTPVSCTITSYCNAVVKAKDKAVKKRLVAACIEYIRYGYDNDWEDEVYYKQPAQSGQGSKGGAGGSLPGLKGGAGGSGKSSSRSGRGQDGGDGKSYTGGIGGKGGAGGKAY